MVSLHQLLQQMYQCFFKYSKYVVMKSPNKHFASLPRNSKRVVIILNVITWEYDNSYALTCIFPSI